MKPLVWLDLCCGLKGASQPAIDRGWKVITVDIDPRFRPTIVADVRALPLRPFHVDVQRSRHPDLVASGPDLSIARAAVAAIDFFDPTWWAIENTIHSRKWLIPDLGRPVFNVGGHYLWANLPTLLPNVNRRSKETMSSSWSAERAKIPYEIGEAICRSVEQRRENGDSSHGNAR